MFSYEHLHTDVQVLDDQNEIIYIRWMDAGFNLEDLPETMDGRDERWKRIR